MGFYRKSKISIFWFKNVIFYAILVIFYKRTDFPMSFAFTET